MRRCTTHALYRSKLWQQDPCQYRQNANPDVQRLRAQLNALDDPSDSYGYGLWCGFKWGLHHATSHLQSRLESQYQSVPGCAEECGDPLVQSGGRWQTLGVAAGLGAGPQVQKGLASEGVLRLCTLLSLAPLLSRPEPAGLLRLVIHQEPTWPHTTPEPAWSPPSAEYSPSSCRRLWKRHAPSSGSVSGWWLRLKAATLNRCQLYYIIKLPELIFSIKVLN